MVTSSLVESDIEAGRRLLDELKKIDSNFLVRSAYWLYRPEAFDWRLFIATPLVDQRGPASVYSDVQGALRSLAPPFTLSLQDISVVSPNDKTVKLVKKEVQIPNGSPGVRLSRTRLNDTYIEDAYIHLQSETKVGPRDVQKLKFVLSLRDRGVPPCSHS